MSNSQLHYDVIIAGSGIYGTSMASILAKEGLKVLIIERGKHPRFALGEALLPQSAIWPFIIGERFRHSGNRAPEPRRQDCRPHYTELAV